MITHNILHRSAPRKGGRDLQLLAYAVVSALLPYAVVSVLLLFGQR